mgnify:CR=1 FL=1
MVTVEDFSDMVNKDVFTNKGKYAGKVTDLGLDMEKFKTRSLIVDAVRGSFLAEVVGHKKGVVVPFQLVESIGDIVIMRHVSPQNIDMPQKTSEEEREEKEESPAVNF